MERLSGTPDLLEESGEEDYPAGIKNVHQPVLFRLRSDHGRIGIVADPGTDRIPGIAEILCRGCCLYGTEGITDNNVFSQACAGSMSQACIIKMHNKVKDKTMITFDEKKYPQITDAEIKDALQFSTEQVIRDLPEFTEKFQKAYSENGFYQPIPNNYWTCGFWTGEIWLAYEYSQDERLKKPGKFR